MTRRKRGIPSEEAPGGDAPEAGKCGGETDLCQAWIYGGASVRRNKVGGQEAIDGPVVLVGAEV